LLIQYDLDVPYVIVGNCCDAEYQRSVSLEEGEALAKKYNCPFFECSAKTGYNVEKIFLVTTSRALACTTENVVKKLVKGGDLAELKKRASLVAAKQQFVDEVFCN
jgi:GTPase SAR1 family protein